jgi:hypothetical protein
MSSQFNTVMVPAADMQLCFENILLNKGFKNDRALENCSSIYE